MITFDCCFRRHFVWAESIKRQQRPHKIKWVVTHTACSETIYGPGSVVGIATGYGLDGPGIESQWGARYSASVHTGPGAHPASCTMGTGSFPGVKSGRGVTLTAYPLLVRWSRKGRAILYFPYGPYGLYRALVPVACTRVYFILPKQFISPSAGPHSSVSDCMEWNRVW
jgi:hypothetical protein